MKSLVEYVPQVYYPSAWEADGAWLNSAWAIYQTLSSTQAKAILCIYLQNKVSLREQRTFRGFFPFEEVNLQFLEQFKIRNK